MELTKILIADDGEEFRQALAQTLGSSYDIRVCGDGQQALELLQSFRPDILVLELALPHLDGLSLLRQIERPNGWPKVLVTARYYSPYMVAALAELRTDYYLQKPCSIQAMACCIADFAAEGKPASAAGKEPENWVSSTLLAMGMAPNLDGFDYLVEGIPIYARDTSQAITKELYVKLGEHFNKHPRQIERSIRSAIDTTWKRSSRQQLAICFPPGPDGRISRPSNGRFIAQLTQYLMAEERKTICA